jgi:hypothetical protein
MALDFPTSPTNGQVYQDPTSGNRYTWNNTYSFWQHEETAITGGSSNTHVLFNDTNFANGTAGFTFNKSTNNVFIANTLQVSSVNSTTFYSGVLLVANSTVINATHLGGKTEATLNVNSALTANNSDFLDGFHAAVFLQNTESRTLSGNIVFSGANVTSTGNLRLSGGLFANGTLGTAKQFLASNGTSVYWVTGDMSFFPDSTFKKSVRAATTADLGGVTATTTTLTASTLVALPAQDGITLAVGDRLLVKDQAAPAQNGIYDVTNLGSAGVTAWVLTRSADADSITELASALVGVDSGTVNGGRLYDNDLRTTDTLGTTACTWNQNIDNGGGTFVGNVVMGTGSTGIYPLSNTVGSALGNTIARWTLLASTGTFAGAVSGITTLAAGNTTITGSVSSTTLATGNSTITGTLSGITTLAAGNTTITGFINVSTTAAIATSLAVGANVTMNTSTIFVGNSTVNTSISANLITLNGANVMTTATTLKVYNAAGSQVFP